jgi:DNA-binding PadR family transcriptional regulator
MNKKIFHGAILESILLNLINDNSNSGLHGYAIYSSLNKKFGIHLGPSTIYPELRHLEKEGLIASKWDFFLGRARRQYRITRKGQGLMTEYNCQLKAIIPATRQMESEAKNLTISQN